MIPFHEGPFFMSCKPASNYVRQCGALFSWTSCCQISWLQSSWVASFAAVFLRHIPKNVCEGDYLLGYLPAFLIDHIWYMFSISLDGAYFFFLCHCHVTLMFILFRSSCFSVHVLLRSFVSLLYLVQVVMFALSSLCHFLVLFLKSCVNVSCF